MLAQCVEDEEAMSKGLGGTPIYRTMTDNKVVCTLWQRMPHAITVAMKYVGCSEYEGLQCRGILSQV
jgi:hypothetical protein